MLQLILCHICLVLARELRNEKPSPLERSPLNIVDKGWQSFEYGPRDTEIYTAFNALESTVPMILRITDLATPGSAFRVHSNGQRVLVTPIPMQDLQKGPTVNPLRAYNSMAWSHGHTILPPGFHHIRVFMRHSPWDQGVGALQVESAEVCEHTVKHQGKKIVLVSNLVDWDAANKLCEAMNGSLADLRRPYSMTPSQHARLLGRIFSLIKACRVDNGMTWIRGSKDSQFQAEDEFPASVQAHSCTEGVTGAEWEMSQMATLCII